MGTKRRITSSSSRPMKKRRFTRRRFKRRVRSRRNQTITTRQLNASTALKYGGRKLGRRKYRNMLWNSSMMNQHYRSILTSTLVDISTNNVHGQMFVGFSNLLNPVHSPQRLSG